MLRVPVIHTKHGRNRPELRNVVLANRLASLLTDQVVAVSADSACVATGLERVPPRKVRTILNGIDLSRFAYFGPCSQGPAVMVARLSPEKDAATLIEAAGIVRAPSGEEDLRGLRAGRVRRG